jgi:drug/metabolite transporter (DMT)-like permease
MLKGIAYALGACFIWGLIFVIPQFMTGFSSIEVALGRYACYGIASACIFSKSWIKGYLRFPRSIWINAFCFSLISTIVYYTAVVLSLRYSNPAICALILGISPVTIALYGNWKKRECSFKSLIPSSILIFIGLIIINAPHFASNGPHSDYIVGLACSFVGLIAWSWYAVANSKFLKNNPTISSNDWSTLMGVATLIWVILCSLALIVAFDDQIIDVNKYLIYNTHSTNYLIGSAILGIVCSWWGAYLWNQASLLLPISLAGQLTIFETIFGLLFVYTLAQYLPPLIECLGIVILLSAVGYSIRFSSHAYAAQHADEK